MNTTSASAPARRRAGAVAIRGALLAAGLASIGFVAPTPIASAAPGGKTTICHRTHSTTSPYRQITVSTSAINGSGGNDHTSHADPPFDPNFAYPANAKNWGDVVPDNSSGGAGAGVNWTAVGQAIYNGTSADGVDYAGTCATMSAQEFFQTEVDAGVPVEDILADLDGQEADEDAAILAELGGSFSNPTGSSPSFSPTTTTVPSTTTTTTVEPSPTTTAPPATTTTVPAGGTTTTTAAPTTTQPTTTTTTPATTSPLGRVEGVIWVDLDRDGVRDPGEAPLPGVVVELVEVVSPPARLTTAGFTAVGSTKGAAKAVTYSGWASSASAPARGAQVGVRSGTIVTDAQGRYTFESVVPGDYAVTARLSASGITPWWDSDGAGDWRVGVVVPVGTATADLAAVGSGSLAGQVYFSSTNGGVTAARVDCTWAGLDGVLGTADDAVFNITAGLDGSFTLDGAPAGDYRCAGVDPATGRASTAVSGTVGVGGITTVRMPVPTPGQLVGRSSLPRTGTSTTVSVAFGLLLVGLGLGFRRLSRFRRSGADIA
ncbi:MAG: LPXTG cell wall anchor domain-containing protein [Actinomycetota bacterium]|nr:LPXTG cell wall anchor domain-containing protein [Actinomycetota bacterium]